MSFKLIENIGVLMSILNTVFNTEEQGGKGSIKQKEAAKRISASKIAKQYPKLTMENIFLIINHVVAILNILGILKDQS